MTEAATIRALLDAHTLNFQDEDELQQGIAQILTAAGIEFEREVRLNTRDRIDFMVGRLGIEAKVDGGLALVTRQLHRYAQLEQIGELLLVTTENRHLAAPTEINGKAVTIHYLSIRRAF